MTKLAIIGAGASGLASAVAAVKEGMSPIVYERSHDIGGVWQVNCHDISQPGRAWPGMKVNISRHTGTFSDFSWPSSTADFPTTEEMYAYLKRYVDHFDLMKYIRFGTKVSQIIPHDNHWVIHGENDGKKFEDEVDAVIVATGKYSKPHIPAFNGLNKIKDKYIHSALFRNSTSYLNKKVLIVGGSLSGTAIAEEIASIAEVTHLLRKERWIVKRYRSSDPKNNGPLLPRDLLKSEALSVVAQTPEEQYQHMQEHCKEQNEFLEWQMLPESPVGFVVADEYLSNVRSQKITPVRGEIDYFTENTAILRDGKCLNFDLVIFCTGYEQDLSFIPVELGSQVQSCLLYEDIFPTTVENIAFIGMYKNARGAVFPIVQLQAELACRIFSGRLDLADKDTIKDEISNTSHERNEINYLNALAEKLGVLPDYSALNLGEKHMIYDGAFTPARFLLNGPHSNKDLALKLIEQTETYRRELLQSNKKVPSLANLCKQKIKII